MYYNLGSFFASLFSIHWQLRNALWLVDSPNTVLRSTFWFTLAEKCSQSFAFADVTSLIFVCNLYCTVVLVCCNFDNLQFWWPDWGLRYCYLFWILEIVRSVSFKLAHHYVTARFATSEQYGSTAVRRTPPATTTRGVRTAESLRWLFQ